MVLKITLKYKKINLFRNYLKKSSVKETRLIGSKSASNWLERRPPLKWLSDSLVGSRAPW